MSKNLMLSALIVDEDTLLCPSPRFAMASEAM